MFQRIFVENPELEAFKKELQADNFELEALSLSYAISEEAEPTVEIKEPKPLVEKNGAVKKGTFIQNDERFLRRAKIKL